MRLLIAALLLALVSPIPARADLSRNQARKVIQTMVGWSLPGSAVRVQSVKSSGNESAEVTAEIQAVFRLRLHEHQWQLREIRTGQDRWERLEVIARARTLNCLLGSVVGHRSLCSVSQIQSSLLSVRVVLLRRSLASRFRPMT